MKRFVEAKKVYVVTMYRWGCVEMHSYVLGVFTTKTKAEKAGEREQEDRGGKYCPLVLEVQLDCSFRESHKEIVKLDDPYGVKRGFRSQAK